MSALVSAKNLSKSFSDKDLFSDLSFSIEDGDRIGLIGANGAGKSTLLKIVCELEEADAGELVKRRFLKIGFVPQEFKFDFSLTVSQVLVEAARRCEIEGSDAELAAQKVVTQLGFSDSDQVTGNLSGGWRRRVSIGTALISDPDLLVLDEPTNHIDTAGWQWLKNLLNGASFSWVLTSHDRFFLESTARRVVEIDKSFEGGLLLTDGNYSDHVKKRLDYFEKLRSRVDGLANKLRREDEWLARNPAARTSKSKSRIEAAEVLRDNYHQTKSRLNTSKANIEFDGTSRKTKKLVELVRAKKSLGEKLIFEELDLVLGPGSRVGVLGANGTGKSTLLKCLASELKLDSGKASFAPDVEIAYFDQARESLSGSWTLKRALGDGSDSVVYRGRSLHIVSWMRRFQFHADQMDTLVEDLSGGERARVLIARLMVRAADVLLLDEPTNDLDIPSLEVLEDSLLDFPGAVVLVSHDRYLVENVCTSFIGFKGDGNHGTFASFDQFERELDPSKTKRKKEKKEREKKSGKKKLSYMEQREFDQMESQILEKEEVVSELKDKLADPAVASNSVELQKLSSELDAAEGSLQTLYDRWAELESKL